MVLGRDWQVDPLLDNYQLFTARHIIFFSRDPCGIQVRQNAFKVSSLGNRYPTINTSPHTTCKGALFTHHPSYLLSLFLFPFSNLIVGASMPGSPPCVFFVGPTTAFR